MNANKLTCLFVEADRDARRTGLPRWNSTRTLIEVNRPQSGRPR